MFENSLAQKGWLQYKKTRKGPITNNERPWPSLYDMDKGILAETASRKTPSPPSLNSSMIETYPESDTCIEQLVSRLEKAMITDNGLIGRYVCPFAASKRIGRG